METSRFFVANLPTNTKEKDLVKLFKDWGEVEKVELKTKDNLVDPENVKVIAFVTLKINTNDINYCVDELNWQKVHGAQIKVSVAKESFLERLKREREEATTVPSKNEPQTNFETTSNVAFQTQNYENKKKLFAEDDALLEAELNDVELLLTKKRAAHSIHNGKIVIQNYDVEPIHVIENKKTKTILDAKSSTADQKRKESLNKKKNQYKQNKSAIQNALSDLHAPSAKKIKFSDCSEEEDELDHVNNKGSNIKSQKSKTNIFGSDNEEDLPNDFDIKPELFGKKGEKLMKMQSKQSLDPRFKIDSKFVDDNDEDEADNNEDDNNYDVDDSERQWQMNILEQVVGTKIDTGNHAQQKAKNKKMLRFDPSKEEHQKFLLPGKDEVTLSNKSKKKKKTMEEHSSDEEATSKKKEPEVSKEVFYVVTDTLSESLKTRGDGFSLLNMFGKVDESEQNRDIQLKQISNEKILVNKSDKNVIRPLGIESSSESEAENEEDAEYTKNNNITAPSDNKVKGKKSSKAKLSMEPFFFIKDDPRLIEAEQFYRVEKKDGPEEDYEEVRNRLKMLIRTKIAKSQKKLPIGARNKKNRAKRKF